MSKFIQFTLLISVAWSSIPEIKGIVRNGNRPIHNAIIVHHNSGSWTMSNEFGLFTIMGEMGDSITVFHYGFKNQPFTIYNSSGIIIQLKLDPLKMKPIDVMGYKPIHTNNFQTKDGRNLSSTMASIPSLSFRTYGGIGALSTMSIDGGLTSHTKILWNGIDLTNPQNGETDLSQMPFFLMDNLTISRTQSLSYGSGSIDGSIAINSSKTSRIKLTSGSFGLRSIAGKLKIPSNRWDTNIGFGQLKSLGDFDFYHQGKSGKTQNNTFNQFFYTLNMNHVISKRCFISLQSLFTQQERGIPGIVFSPTPDAQRNDNLQLIDLQSFWQIPDHLFSVSVTSRRSHEHYINPIYAVNSQHDLTASQFDIGWKSSRYESIEMDQKFVFRKEDISSTETKNHDRLIQSYANSIYWLLSDNFLNENGLRFDYEKDRFRVWTWQSGFEYQKENGSVSIMAGNGFRYPTFNDLFWNPGGNTELLPESTKWTRIQWKATFHKHNLSIRQSSKKSKNLIKWIPGEDYWQPQNIAFSQRNTTTITSDGILVTHFRYNAHFSYNNSKNLTQNKQLRYAPKYLGSFSLETTFISINGWFQGQYTGEKITLYSWPKNVTLDPFFIFSGGLNWLLNKQTNLGFTIENLLNKDYMTVNGYPEPRRSFSFSIQYNPQLKKIN